MYVFPQLITYLITYLLTHLLTYSLTHLLAYLLTHLLTYSPITSYAFGVLSDTQVVNLVQYVDPVHMIRYTLRMLLIYTKLSVQFGMYMYVCMYVYVCTYVCMYSIQSHWRGFRARKLYKKLLASIPPTDPIKRREFFMKKVIKYVSMYVCMYVCKYVGVYIYWVSEFACMYTNIVLVCVYVCMYVCMCACVCVCVCVIVFGDDNYVSSTY